MPRRDKDKPETQRDRAGHFIETDELDQSRPDLDRAQAADRRRASRSEPKGSEGDKGESGRRRQRT